MKTIDGMTGQIIDDTAPPRYSAPYDTQTGFGETSPATTPNVPAIATFLGVPVGWVIVAGLVLLVLPRLMKRGR